MRFAIPCIVVVAAFAATGAALPPSCDDPCTILAATPGFLPPAASIQSGTDVVFQSIDITHPVGEALAGIDPCFIASSSASTSSAPVTFTWDGHVLRADGTECSTAMTLPTGEGIIGYMCLLHPNMVGTLTVS